MPLRVMLLSSALAVLLATDAQAQGGGPVPAAPAASPAPATGNANAPRRQPSAAQAAQQDRMRRCNAQATERGLRGDARRGFMRTCLSGRDTPAAAQAAPSPGN